MAFSKIILNGVTQMDLTQDTINAARTLQSYTGHNAAGESFVGSYVEPQPGTEGTPVATKGSVSNHSISITPSVTNIGGVIQGGTHTGTAATVSASELVSGTYNVTSAGTHNVINYASASVPELSVGIDYSDRYYTESSVRKFQVIPYVALDGDQGWLSDDISSSITYNAVPSNTTVTPSTSAQTIGGANYMMESAVTVSAMPTGTAGTPTATKGTVSNHSVSVTPSVTNTTGYITGSTKTGTAVTVSASELVSGSQTVTQNGTVDVTNLAQVVVDVQGGGGSSAQVDTVMRDPGGDTYTAIFTGLKGQPTSFYVSVDVQVSTSTQSAISAVVYDGSSIHTQTITNTSNAQVSYVSTGVSYTYSNGTLTVTSTGPVFVDDDYALTYTYGGSASDVDTFDVQVGSGATSITFTGLEDEPIAWSCIFKSNFSTSSGYQRVIATGYNGTSVIGLAMDSAAHPSNSYWTQSYSNGSLTITSQGTNAGGYFHQPGYYQLTAVYGEASPYQAKTVTPTTSQQIVEADSGYDALSRVTVNAIPSEYVIPSGNLAITQNGTGINVASYATVSVNVSGSSASIDTKTLSNSTNTATSLQFTSMKGQPIAYFLRCQTQIQSSGNTSYYYVDSMRYNGTNTQGTYVRIGSTRGIYPDSSHYSYTYSGTTLTVTTSGSRTGSGGSFYNGTYELVYVY